MPLPFPLGHAIHKTNLVEIGIAGRQARLDPGGQGLMADAQLQADLGKGTPVGEHPQGLFLEPVDTRLICKQRGRRHGQKR